MISVIVVTRNRREWVQACVRSLMEQDYQGAREIIVIDDASADRTTDGLRRSFGASLRLIAHPSERGLSISKNEGVELSRGSFLAFTDDDCVVSSSWLRRVASALETADMAAGSVLPLGNPRWPFWWRRSLDWTVGLSAAGRRFLPLGSNLAMRREIFEKIGGYAAAINRTSRALWFGEDIEIFQRAMRHGARFCRDDGMVVYHHVPEGRLKPSYLFWRSYMEGRSLALRDSGGRERGKRCAALVIHPLRFLISLDPHCLCRAAVSLGYFHGYRHRRTFLA